MLVLPGLWVLVATVVVLLPTVLVAVVVVPAITVVVVVAPTRTTLLVVAVVGRVTTPRRTCRARSWAPATPATEP